MLGRWLSKKQARQETGKKKNLASLERRTADIRDKLARLSLGTGFRRHSAPAQSSHESSESPDKTLHYGSRPSERYADPVELSRLPAPIVELVLDQLSLQVIVLTIYEFRKACSPCLPGSLNEANS